MKVLVIGGGGREHALCWSLARAPEVDEVVCAPGNAGIARLARCAHVKPEDPSAVRALAEREAADLVVVGPEGPLVAGVADALREAGITVFGPSAAAARLEGSKAFAKDVLHQAGVPTGAHWTGTDPDAAKEALEGFAPPYVVKADGLAAGKGVTVCDTRAEAHAAIDEALLARAFGEAGARVVLEEHLAGPELSVFAISDGKRVALLAPAQDHKRVGEGDTGPNTGGMGAYSPVPIADDALLERVRREALQPTIEAMAARGTPYQGVLYAGLVLTREGPKVLEYNCRFGDPEAQVILPRLAGSLAATLRSAARGRLSQTRLPTTDAAAVTVVLAAAGYPGRYEKGARIRGLESLAAREDVLVFHAGTVKREGQLLADGGRILAVTGLGADLSAARDAAYDAVDRIHVEGAFCRRDIAAQAIEGPGRAD